MPTVEPKNANWKLLVGRFGIGLIVLAGIVKIIDDGDLPLGLLMIGFALLMLTHFETQQR